MKKVFIMLCILFFSCSKEKVLTMLTDEYSIREAVNIFNAENKQFKVVLEFDQEPKKNFERMDFPVDILISHQMNYDDLMKKMYEISSLNIKRDIIFYNSLIESAKLDGHLKLIPLNFNLNIVARKTDLPIEKEVLYKDLFSEQKYYVNLENNLDLAFGYLAYNGIDFAKHNKLSNIKKPVQEILANLLKNSKNATDKNTFSFYIGNTNLDLYFTNTLEYYKSYSFVKNENLTFSFLKNNDGKLLASDDVLYLGIPKTSKKTRMAYEFINWLLSEESQNKILNTNSYSKENVFGLFGGYSSLVIFNNLYFKEYYTNFDIHGMDIITNFKKVSPGFAEFKKNKVLPFIKEVTTNLD